MCALSALRFCELHKFEKPNDKRALDLMDACAKVNLSLAWVNQGDVVYS